jgi:hypothetical protein
MNSRFARLCAWASMSMGLIFCGSSDSPPEGPKPGQEGGAPADGSRDETGGEAGGGDATLPAFDPSTPIGNLTQEQKGRLCDWEMNELGGYGFTMDCGNSISVANPMTQAECISTRLNFSCTVTVGQLETCTLAMAPSHGCIYPNAECRPLGCI